MTVRPSGLFPARRDLREKLVGRDARRRGQAGVGANAFLQPARDRRRERLAPRVLRDVQVRLVERQRLDERRHLAEDREHGVRRGLVAREIRPHDDERRAEAHGLGHRHRRADAERARLVARRRHDAAAIRLAADGQRLAAQRRVVALLDRRVERVHVDVEDPAHGND